MVNLSAILPSFLSAVFGAPADSGDTIDSGRRDFIAGAVAVATFGGAGASAHARAPAQSPQFPLFEFDPDLEVRVLQASRGMPNLTTEELVAKLAGTGLEPDPDLDFRKYGGQNAAAQSMRRRLRIYGAHAAYVQYFGIEFFAAAACLVAVPPDVPAPHDTELLPGCAHLTVAEFQLFLRLHEEKHCTAGHVWNDISVQYVEYLGENEADVHAAYAALMAGVKPASLLEFAAGRSRGTLSHFTAPALLAVLADVEQNGLPNTAEEVAERARNILHGTASSPAYVLTPEQFATLSRLQQRADRAEAISVAAGVTPVAPSPDDAALVAALEKFLDQVEDARLVVNPGSMPSAYWNMYLGYKEIAAQHGVEPARPGWAARDDARGGGR